MPKTSDDPEPLVRMLKSMRCHSPALVSIPAHSEDVTEYLGCRLVVKNDERIVHAVVAKAIECA